MNEHEATSYQVTGTAQHPAILIHYLTGNIGFRGGFLTLADALDWIWAKEVHAQTVADRGAVGVAH
jgi:hypothetical protein